MLNIPSFDWIFTQPHDDGDCWQSIAMVLPESQARECLVMIKRDILELSRKLTPLLPTEEPVLDIGTSQELSELFETLDEALKVHTILLLSLSFEGIPIDLSDNLSECPICLAQCDARVSH